LAVVALLVHLIVVVVGPCRCKSSWKTAWIASNAAIGGPATAAAFRNRMKYNSDGDNNQLLQGRTMVAATVWGVVGYAIGTTLGVAIYRAIGGGIVVELTNSIVVQPSNVEIYKISKKSSTTQI
jgi:uncharacterized membrane protein